MIDDVKSITKKPERERIINIHFDLYLSMEIKTIRSLQELETVGAYWDSWQNHPNTDFDHFKLVCQLRQEAVIPYVTVIERDGKPCTLLAARLERTCFMPSIGYLKPIRIPATVLAVVYKGLLGQENEEVSEALVRHLWSFLTSGEADAVVFHHLPEHSPLLKALLVHSSRWFCEKKPMLSGHWDMALPEADGGFLQHKVRSKHRSWIRKKQRELESAFPGKVSWRWMSSFDDVPGLCRMLEGVAARTYQRKLGAGFVDNEEHRQRFALFARRGQLRVQLLEIDGRIRAFWIGTVYKDVFHSSETGYEQDLRKYEAGTLVFIRMVDELVQEGVRKFDFGLGEALYKQRFGDQCWQEATVRLFAPTVKGIVLRSSLGFLGLLDGAGRRLLRKVGALDRLKTVWRRRLTEPGSEAEEK